SRGESVGHVLRRRSDHRVHSHRSCERAEACRRGAHHRRADGIVMFLRALYQRCESRPRAIAVEVLAADPSGEATTYTYREFWVRAAGLGRPLCDRLARDGAPPKLAIAAANGPLWVIADLALQLLGWISVPLALEFSAQQAAALLHGTCAVLVD